LQIADTNVVVDEAPRPRNDVDQAVTWKLSAHAGQRGYIEATDADTGTAYAWLAFGRFQPAVVTLPRPQIAQKEQLQTALDIVAALRLTELAGPVERGLSNP